MAFTKMTLARFFICFFMFFSSFSLYFGTAIAAVLINPPAPYPQNPPLSTTTTAGTYTISYAGNLTGTPTSGFIDNKTGFRFINTANSDASTYLVFDVMSNAASSITIPSGQVLVATLSLTTTHGSEIPVIAAGGYTGTTIPTTCDGCQAVSGFNYSVNYNPGSILRLAVRLGDFCGTYGAPVPVGTVASPFCNGTAVATSANTTLTQNVIVTFGPALPGTQGPLTGTETATFSLNITDVAPILSSTTPPSDSAFYFPGDGQISLKYDWLTASPGTGSTSVAGVGLYRYVVLGNLSPPGVTYPIFGGDTNTWLTANPIFQFSNYGMGSDTITGFTNASSDSDSAHNYEVGFYIENNAGLMSASPATFTSIKARGITGLLTESQCFIATATYHDGRAAPVMMLRKFRDEILLKSEWGKKFVETYYHYSPDLARWAWDKPFIRSIALKALTPIELAAWAILKIAHSEQVEPSSSDTVQPYIEQLKKKIAAEDAKNGTSTPQSATSYIEEQKKLLPPEKNGPTESYSESLKKKLKTEEDSKDYSEKEKAKIPAEDSESVITKVKEGRDAIAFKKKGEPQYAASFKLGLSPGMQVFVNNGTPSNTFSAIYGSNWNPDVWLHFEHLLTNSYWLGSLAGTVDFGVNYASGYGVLAFPFDGSTQSQTRFSFVQVPFLLGIDYRLNLMKYVRPYVGASVGTMTYAEIRNDGQKNKGGISGIYSVSAGASLLLDFMDKNTSRESYLSSGLQHVYLFAEYTYLNTFTGNVTFRRGGLYAGFMFEF